MRDRLALVVFFVSSASFGQETDRKYYLDGIEDSLSYAVAVEQDLVSEITTVRLNDHALQIFGVQDIKSTRIHANRFLEIQFRTRAGSGVRIRRTVMLCVSGNRIYKSLDVLSEVTSRMNRVYNKLADSLKMFDESEVYYVSLSVNHIDGSQYTTVLAEIKTIESKYDSTQNVFFAKEHELYFDLGGCFFYNSSQRLNKLYKVYSVREGQTTDRVISRDVPCIQLFESRYLYLDGEWCLDNGQGVLSCL